MSDRRLQLALLSVCSFAALTGCQVVTGSEYAQVRLIQVSPDAPAVDFYQNSSPVLYGISPGSTSSYMEIPAGSYTFAVNTAGTRQQLASASGALSAGAQYTVLVGDATASMQMTILKDQAAPAPANQVALRLLDEGTRTGAVDLYLVAPGSKLAGTSPVAVNVLFGHSPAYVEVPSGTYSLVALPAGSSASAGPAPLYSGSQAEYSAGSARTVVLYDRPSVDVPRLQALETDDFVPQAE